MIPTFCVTVKTQTILVFISFQATAWTKRAEGALSLAPERLPANFSACIVPIVKSKYVVNLIEAVSHTIWSGITPFEVIY